MNRCYFKKFFILSLLTVFLLQSGCASMQKKKGTAEAKKKKKTVVDLIKGPLSSLNSEKDKKNK